METNYDVRASGPTVLPKQAKIGMKSKLPWQQYRWSLPPTNDTSYESETNIIYNVKLADNTQKGRMKWIFGPASYHGTNVQLTATNGAAFDSCGANSLIDRITEIGADVVQDARKTNAYLCIQYDFTIDFLQRRSFFSFFGCGDMSSIDRAGTSTAATTAANLTTYWATNLALATQLTVLIPSGTGPTIPANAANVLADILWAGISSLSCSGKTQNMGDYLATGASLYYAQIIPGSVIGALQNRLFPLSELAQGYELTFYLETLNNAMIGDQTTIKMDKNRLHLCVIEYNETLSNLLRASFENIFVIPTTYLEYYSTQISTAAAQTNYTWAVPCNILNAKGIIFSFRRSASLVKGYQSLGLRCRLGISSHQLMIGNRMLPSNRFITMPGATSTPDNEGFLESMLFFNNTISANGSVGNVDYASFNNYVSAAQAILPDTKGTFVMAYNLEGLFDAQDSEYRSGVNLESNTTSITFTTTAADSGTATLDCWILGEMDLVVAQGVLTTKNKKSMNPEYMQPSQF